MTTINFRQRVLKGESLFGTFIQFSSPSAVEAIGLAGFDYVIIDLEHAPINFEPVEHMVRAAHEGGCAALVRSTFNRPYYLGRVLDTGADGIQVPHVSSAEEARAAVEASRFAPLGHRGMNPFIRAGRWGHITMQEFVQSQNETQTVILQVEGKEGMDNLEEIMDVPGYDVLFLGPVDLSQSLGVPGQIKDPKVIDAMQRIAETGKKKGKAVSTFVTNADDGAYWNQQGIQLVAVASDAYHMYLGFVNSRKKLRWE
jgi:4-hydroxy-2-oxoheptanedioate aldolase